jgi:hypothetical protein
LATANTTVTAQLLNAIRSRKFNQIGRLCASDIDFQAWTPVGHWVANDPSTVAKIIEVWFTPGAGASVIVESRETTEQELREYIEKDPTVKAEADATTAVP